MGTTDIELQAEAKRLQLKNFRGCFMRDELKVALRQECGILNLDSSHNEGTHWTCWFKDGNRKYYCDSFGIVPPKELIEYLKSPILCSTYQMQNINDTNCGQWCLHVLNELSKGRDFIDVINNIAFKIKS